MAKAPEPAHVAVVGPVPPLRGGIAQHTARVVAALRAAGTEVTVISWRQQYPRMFYKSDQTDGSGSSMDSANYRLRWWAPWTWFATGRAVRHADALVLPWVHPIQALALRTVAMAAGRRPVVIALVHNVVPHERFRGDRWATKRFFAGADAAIVQTPELEDQVRLFAPDIPIVTVPHPPNLDIPRLPLPPAGTLRLLFLGFVRPYKGVDLLLEAVAGLKGDRDIALTIAGELWEPNEQQLRKELTRVGLNDVVTLLPGYRSDTEVAQLLADHHLVVAPYRDATQSGIVPLAQAAGRPSVVTPVGGLARQITDGLDGVVAEGVDSQSISRAIVRAAARLDALAAGAADAAPKWSAFADAVSDLVDAVLEQRGASGDARQSGLR